MHWLTFIFGFLSLYCCAGFAYCMAIGGANEAHGALVIFGVGAVVFALASFVNQKRHANAKRRAQAPATESID